MRIYACVKQVPDTAARITVTGDAGFSETCKFIVNPFDEIGVEEAVRLAKTFTGSEVVVVTVGKEAAVNAIRAALALGADRGILVKTDAQFLDSRTTALALKTVIEGDGVPDIVFAGKQSIDSEGMQTLFRLGQALGMPVINDVVKLSVDGRTAVAEREIEGGGREVLEASLPCVIGASRGLNEPHYPKLPEILQAKKKEVRVINAAALGLSPGDGHTQILRLEPVPERGPAQMLPGTPREQVDRLIVLLAEKEKLI